MALSNDPRKQWTTLSQAERDAAYDNNKAVANSAALIEERNRASAALRATQRSVLDVPYGAGERTKSDLYPSADKAAPCLLFIHGGYWQRNDKEPLHCLATGLLAHDVNFATLEYTLAPNATMDEIVAEVDACATYLHARLQELGADPKRLAVGGLSAGGHLTATLREHPAFTGILPISGLFDLEPIQLSYLNVALRMDMETARRNSPLLHLQSSHPAIITVGGAELPELVRQSRELHEAYQAKDLQSELIVLPGEDHFSILEQLAAPEGVLTRAALKLLGE